MPRVEENNINVCKYPEFIEAIKKIGVNNQAIHNVHYTGAYIRSLLMDISGHFSRGPSYGDFADKFYREKAVEALGMLELGEEKTQVISTLLKALSDRAAPVRACAAKVLVAIIDKVDDDVIDQLVKLLFDDQFKTVAGDAEQALIALSKKIDPNRIVIKLIPILISSTYQPAQVSAAFILGQLRLNSDQVIDALLQGLYNSNYAVRCTCVSALKNLTVGQYRADVFNKLLSLRFDKSKTVKDAVITALNKFPNQFLKTEKKPQNLLETQLITNARLPVTNNNPATVNEQTMEAVLPQLSSKIPDVIQENLPIQNNKQENTPLFTELSNATELKKNNQFISRRPLPIQQLLQQGRIEPLRTNFIAIVFHDLSLAKAFQEKLMEIGIENRGMLGEPRKIEPFTDPDSNNNSQDCYTIELTMDEFDALQPNEQILQKAEQDIVTGKEGKQEIELPLPLGKKEDWTVLLSPTTVVPNGSHTNEMEIQSISKESTADKIQKEVAENKQEGQSSEVLLNQQMVVNSPQLISTEIAINAISFAEVNPEKIISGHVQLSTINNKSIENKQEIKDSPSLVKENESLKIEGKLLQDKVLAYEQQLLEFLAQNKNWLTIVEALKQKMDDETLSNQELQKLIRAKEAAIKGLDKTTQQKIRELERQLKSEVIKFANAELKLKNEITQIKTDQQLLLDQYRQSEKLKTEQAALKQDPAVKAFYKTLSLQLKLNLKAGLLLSTNKFKLEDTKQQKIAGYAIDSVCMAASCALGFIPIAGPIVSTLGGLVGYIIKEVVVSKQGEKKKEEYEIVKESLDSADIKVVAEYFARKLAQSYESNIQKIEITSAKRLGNMLGDFIYNKLATGVIAIEESALLDIVLDNLKKVLREELVKEKNYFSEIKEIAYPVFNLAVPTPLAQNQSKFFANTSQAQLSQTQTTQSQQSDCCKPCTII